MNRWKCCLYAALAVSALSVAGVFGAKPLMAQVRAALIQNVDEPGRNPYQETQFATCAGQNCNFTFEPVPAGKRLVLTHVNGYVDVKGGTFPNSYLQSSFGGSQYATVFIPGEKGTVFSNSTRIVYNANVQAYFGPGEQPSAAYLLFSTPDLFNGGALLSLTGYYVSLP